MGAAPPLSYRICGSDTALAQRWLRRLMANKTKVTPQNEEVPEKEGPETPPDSQLLDLSDAAVKTLIRSAKKRDSEFAAVDAQPRNVHGFRRYVAAVQILRAVCRGRRAVPPYAVDRRPRSHHRRHRARFREFCAHTERRADSDERRLHRYAPKADYRHRGWEDRDQRNGHPAL